jgi:hypothetical protein
VASSASVRSSGGMRAWSRRRARESMQYRRANGTG